jgi:hypothetical protein
MHRLRHVVPLGALVLFTAVSPALAGPPLLCHPFDIGNARSLPWDGREWAQGRADYNLANLVTDTESILTSTAPVIVRMETLRRAALYASHDSGAAARLLDMVNTRAAAAERAGASPEATTLALFDAGYLRETYRQISLLGRFSGLGKRSRTIAGVLGQAEGMTLVRRVASQHPDDGAIQFAAALVTATTDKTAYARHAAKAREAAARDPLLARNIKQVS